MQMVVIGSQGHQVTLAANAWRKRAGESFAVRRSVGEASDTQRPARGMQRIAYTARAT